MDSQNHGNTHEKRLSNNKRRHGNKQQVAQHLQSNADTDEEISTKTKVLIVGDSQLRHVDPDKLSNAQRSIEVLCQPGMRIEETTKKFGINYFELIIVHAGTLNARDMSPEELTDAICNTLDIVQNNNPNARVAYSALFKRSDDHSLTAKVREVNKLVEDKLSLKGIDFIENNNIIFSNLKRDGLHLNDGGVRKFSSNLSKFVKYR